MLLAGEVGGRIANALFRLQLVHLLDVDGETTGRVQSSGAHVALEVLRLLVLHEDWGKGDKYTPNAQHVDAHPFHPQIRAHSTSTMAG